MLRGKLLKCIIALLVLSVSVSSFSEGAVTLQVQLMIQSSGVAITETKDVVVRLMYESDVGAQMSWQKEYQSVDIIEGALNIELSGAGDDGGDLTASHFDEIGVFLELEIDSEVVTLELVSQPYAIKSRISDMSHATKGIHDVPIRNVENLVDGDLLVYQEGEWVPASDSDGYTGIAATINKYIRLESLEDIDISGLQDGDMLSFDGASWVNVPEKGLSPNAVAKINH